MKFFYPLLAALERLRFATAICMALFCARCELGATDFRRVGAHPIAVDASLLTHRNIHGLAAWKGRIYMGLGHWNDRPGPIALTSYDPEKNAFVVEHSAGSDAIAIFREIRERLFVPSIDPAHFRETVDYVYHDGHRWFDRSPVGPLHLFDMATFTDSDIWAVGGGAPVGTQLGGAVAYRSLDDGSTWANVTPPENTAGASRYFWCVSYKGRLHIRGQAFDGFGWSPTAAAPTFYNKATVVSAPSGEVVVGRAGLSPGVSVTEAMLSAGTPRLSRFDGSEFTIIASPVLDFAAHDDRVYAIRELSGERQILIYEDIAHASPVAIDDAFTSIPSDALSIAIADGVVWLGTASGDLYAASLPNSPSAPIPSASLEIRVTQPDMFGTEISTDGEWLAVAAPHQSGLHPEMGAVHLFSNPGNAGDWTYHSTLEPPESRQSQARFFGRSISLSGNLLAVAESGSPYEGPNRGEDSMVFVYQLQQNTWESIETFEASFIQSVAVHGNSLAIGRRTSPGFVDYCDFFEFDGSSFSLTQSLNLALLGLDPDVRWPLITPIIADDRAVVGIGGDLTFFGGPGEVWIAEPNGSGQWDFDDASVLKNETPENYPRPLHADGLGRALSIDGDIVAVGAPADDRGAPQSGSVVVLELTETPVRFDLLAPEPTDEANFGHAVLVQGGTLYVGAPGVSNTLGSLGSVYQYERGEETWNYVCKIEPSNSSQFGFGTAIAMSGDTLIVGSKRSEPNGAAELSRLELISTNEAIYSYSDWASGLGLAGEDALPDSNYDDDAYSNAIEYAMGLPLAHADDVVNNDFIPLSVSIEDGALVLDWKRRLQSATQGFRYQIEQSGDLSNWIQWEPIDAFLNVSRDGIEWEALTLRQPTEIAISPQFYRLTVNYQGPILPENPVAQPFVKPVPPVGSDPNAVRIIGTLPISSNSGNSATTMRAYPFQMPAEFSYTLDSLIILSIGNDIPNYSIWTVEGTAPARKLVAFQRAPQSGFETHTLLPEESVTLAAGSSYALVYEGPGGWRNNKSAANPPTGAASPLIHETDFLQSVNNGASWTTLDGAEGVVSGPDSWGFGRVAFELKGVPVEQP